MKKTEKIEVLTRQEEIELLRKAQKGKTRQERLKATRLLVYYNQSFVKYMVKGFYYPQGEISPDELMAEGIISLPQAIKDFDLRKLDNRLASYAGYWVQQGIRKFIKESQLLPQAKPKSVSPSLEEEEKPEKKKPTNQASWAIVYYDKDYQDRERGDDKATLLLDTLADDGNEHFEKEEIQKQERRKKIDNLLSRLKPHQELIVRLFFGLFPANWEQIIRLLNKKKLQGVTLKSKDPKNSPIYQKYSKFFAFPRQKEEVAHLVLSAEFWEYFPEFPEITESEKVPRSSKSQSSSSRKKEPDYQSSSRWSRLGYQQEDLKDPLNQALEKLAITKKEKERWQKAEPSDPDSKLLVRQLSKVLEKWKKNALEQLKLAKEILAIS